MKDFPMFTTEYGLASLVLKEIPYKEEAYITIRTSDQPAELLAECVSFCRICGAERIYAKGHDSLEAYPLHTATLEMEKLVEAGPAPAELVPVTAETVGQWRSICNERMRTVDNAATLESRDEKWILESGGAYFIYYKEELLGIGWIDKGELMAVAAVKPGAGRQIMETLLTLMDGQVLRLQVASTNAKAIRLYERLGFRQTKEVSRWYQVFPPVTR